jgi:hypothetical protein
MRIGAMPVDKLSAVTFPPSVGCDNPMNLYRVVLVCLICRYTIKLPINHDLTSSNFGFVLRCGAGILKAGDLCPSLCKGLVHYIHPRSMNDRFDRSDCNKPFKTLPAALILKRLLVDAMPE